MTAFTTTTQHSREHELSAEQFDNTLGEWLHSPQGREAIATLNAVIEDACRQGDMDAPAWPSLLSTFCDVCAFTWAIATYGDSWPEFRTWFYAPDGQDCLTTIAAYAIQHRDVVPADHLVAVDSLLWMLARDRRPRVDSRRRVN